MAPIRGGGRVGCLRGRARTAASPLDRGWFFDTKVAKDTKVVFGLRRELQAGFLLGNGLKIFFAPFVVFVPFVSKRPWMHRRNWPSGRGAAGVLPRLHQLAKLAAVKRAERRHVRPDRERL